MRKQRQDASLRTCWDLASEGLRVYGIRDGLLSRTVIGDLDEECARVVVPKGEEKDTRTSA